MKSALAVSAVFSVLSASADAYANPLSCSGTCTNAHDPSLVRRDDGTYFRFSTGKSSLRFDWDVLSRVTI
jgi:arabinan endo-1,5-alpha-L-arabinosidase